MEEVKKTRSFTLSEKEQETFEKWKLMQEKKFKKRKIEFRGSRFSVEFVLGNIGDTLVVHDKALGESKNITDYDRW